MEATIWLASQMQEQYGLNVKVQSDGKPTALDEKLRVLVFYAVRELLFNIVKHAGTLQGTVAFTHQDDHLRVVVSDTGKGFDSSAILNSPGTAHGLQAIKHRLNLAGCTIEVSSQPGKGTQTRIEVPYEKPDS